MAYEVPTLLIIIEDLRKKLQYYEQHKCQCFPRQQPSPPPDEEYGNGSLNIIRFDPKVVDNSKVDDSRRWRIAADQLVSSVPKAKAWVQLRKDLKLDYTSAIRMVSGASSSSIVSGADNHNPPAGANDLISSGIAFARITKRSQDYKTLLEYIVVSLAVIYQKHGIELSLINDMMREISNSDDKHLRRMRRGAVWLNNLIAQLWAATHWGRRACDAVFFSGLPISKCTRLRESELCKPFIVDKLSDAQFTNEEVKSLNDLPLLIPVFIKTIVGDELTCEEICTALGYQDFVGEITELCSQYESLLNSIKKRKFEGAQRDSLDYENIRVEDGLRWEKVFNPFMGATGMGAEIDGLHPETLQASI